MVDLRLIAADVLKLRRRRGMLSITLMLTLGVMALAFTVMAVQHGGNPTFSYLFAKRMPRWPSS